MKHILPYNKIFESKVSDNILDLLDDTFLDWIDDKELFEERKLDIIGYKPSLDQDWTKATPNIDDYIIYRYEIKLKNKFDIDEVVPKVNFLNKTRFIVFSYSCESSNSIKNGEYSYTGYASIIFTHTNIRYKLSGELQNYLDGFKKLGFRELQSMGDRWELEKMVNVETEKVADPKWFKLDGGLRSVFGGKPYALFGEDYEKSIQDQIKILFDEIPDFSKDNKIKKYTGGEVHIRKQSDDFYVEIRFNLKVRKNKPPYVYMGVFIKNNIV